MGSLYSGLYRDYFIYIQQYSRAGVRLTTWSLIFTVFNIGLSIGVVIAVGMLLFFQIRSIIKNRTGIEDWVLDKAVYRRKMMTRAAREAGDGEYHAEPFVYPYDLGSLWKNISQVLNFTCSPIGDGVTWPVVDGCDQYTLTVGKKFSDKYRDSQSGFYHLFKREQLAQKVEKRARTRRYRIISKVSGSWMPFWSQGFKVCVHPPLTDEPRIALNIGDFVNVTRWRKHWLFGEKIEEDTEIEKPATNGKKGKDNEHQLFIKRRTRGWFPRQCAAEFFEDNDYDSDKEFDDGNQQKKSN